MSIKRVPGKLTKALTLAISGVLLVSAGILAGAALSRQNAPETEPQPSSAIELSAVPEVIELPPTPIATPAPPPPATPEANPASIEEQVVAPGSRMSWVTNFTLCGHAHEDVRLERDLIGLTQEQVTAAVKEDWTLESFSRAELKFSREAELYCPDHLLLKSVPKGLGVYKTELATLELQEIMKFTLDMANLDNETQAFLDQGMPFDDLEEIEGYIESLES